MINDSNRLNILLVAVILIAVISFCYLGLVEGLLMLIKNLVITIFAVGGTLFTIFWVAKTDFSTKEIVNRGLVFDVVEYKFIEGEGVSVFTNKSRISSVIDPIYKVVQKKYLIGYFFILFVSWFSMVISSVKNLSFENIYIEINRQITDELFSLVILGLFSILYLFFLYEKLTKWCIQLILEDTVHYFEEKLGKPHKEAYYLLEQTAKELPMYESYSDYQVAVLKFNGTDKALSQESIKKAWLSKNFDQLFNLIEKCVVGLRNFPFPTNSKGSTNQQQSSNTQSNSRNAYTLDEAYNLVGLSRNSSDEECRQVFSNYYRRYHPDHAVNEKDRQDREEKLREITRAFDTIRKLHRTHISKW